MKYNLLKIYEFERVIEISIPVKKTWNAFREYMSQHRDCQYSYYDYQGKILASSK